MRFFQLCIRVCRVRPTHGGARDVLWDATDQTGKWSTHRCVWFRLYKGAKGSQTRNKKLDLRNIIVLLSRKICLVFFYYDGLKWPFSNLNKNCRDYPTSWTKGLDSKSFNEYLCIWALSNNIAFEGHLYFNSDQKRGIASITIYKW